MMDDQEFIPTPTTGETITVGEYVERLLADQSYYATILPRIPAQIDKEIQKRLLLIPEKRQRRKENLENIHDFQGDKPIYFQNPSTNDWQKGTITEVSPEGVSISYYDENNEEILKKMDFSEVLPCYEDEQSEGDYSDDHDRKRKHKSKKHRKRSRSRSRSRSGSNDSRRRKRHKEDKSKRSYRESKPQTHNLEEEVRRRRMNQASSASRSGYNMKASSYKTALSLAMPVGLGNRDSRSPTPERKFVEIENTAKQRKTEKVLKVDENELEKQNQQQNERLERLKKLYQS